MIVVSSTVSCRRAAVRVVVSSRRSARIWVTATGCSMNGSPDSRHLALMRGLGDAVCLLQLPHVGLRVVGPDRLQQRSRGCWAAGSRCGAGAVGAGAPSGAAAVRRGPLRGCPSQPVYAGHPARTRRAALSSEINVKTSYPPSLLASLEEPELDQARDAADLPADPLDQRGRRLRRPAGREHVVDDEDALPRLRRRRGGSRATRSRTRGRRTRRRSRAGACPPCARGSRPAPKW